MSIDFSQWVRYETAIRGWNLTELARAAHLSPTAVQHGIRLPRAEFCDALARALNIRPEMVCRAAGLLPPDPNEWHQRRKLRETLEYCAQHLDEDDLEMFLREAIKRLTAQADKNRASWPAPDPDAAFEEEMDTLLPRIPAGDRDIMLTLARALADRGALGTPAEKQHGV